MESLPDDILKSFPLILRQINKKFRDVVSLCNGWINFNKIPAEYMDEIISDRLNVKYLIIDGADLSWCFPNIQELRVITSNTISGSTPINFTKYKKLEKIFIDCTCDEHLRERVNVNVKVYSRNIYLYGQISMSNVVYTHNLEKCYGKDFVKMYYYHSDTFMEYLEYGLGTKTVFYFDGIETIGRFFKSIKYYDIAKGKIFIDLGDYDCKTTQDFCQHFKIKISQIEQYIEDKTIQFIPINYRVSELQN